MIDRIAENIVELNRVRCGGIDDRGGPHGRKPAGREQPRVTVADILAQRLDQAGRGLNHAAGRGGGAPVNDRAFGPVQGQFGNVVCSLRDGIIGDIVQ